MVLRTPFLEPVRDLFRSSSRQITVVSPFINRFGLDVLQEALEKHQGDGPPIPIILTCLSVNSILGGSLEIGSLVEFCRQRRSCRVCNLPGLHAKVYVADESRAILASANLTRAGLVGNYEYGIQITDDTTVGKVLADMNDYADLGATLEIDDLAELAERAKELRGAQTQSEKALRKSKAWKELAAKIDALRDNLLRTRVRSKSVNSIFADTIRYLLRRAPMSTEQLEQRIQAIHPDMCDDTIDRVINGMHFGKKWKHMVRNSQQFLKRRGEIEFRSPLWRYV